MGDSIEVQFERRARDAPDGYGSGSPTRMQVIAATPSFGVRQHLQHLQLLSKHEEPSFMITWPTTRTRQGWLARNAGRQ
jgi:hypothetical protein